MLGFSSTLHSTHYLVDFIHCHELSLHLHRNALTFPLSPNCLFMHPHMDISWLPQTKYVHNWIFLILLLLCWATLSWSLVCHPIILAMNMLSLIHLLCHSHTYYLLHRMFFWSCLFKSLYCRLILPLGAYKGCLGSFSSACTLGSHQSCSSTISIYHGIPLTQNISVLILYWISILYIKTVKTCHHLLINNFLVSSPTTLFHILYSQFMKLIMAPL